MSAFSPDLGAVEKFSRRISRFARTQTSHPIRALQIVAREIKFGYHRMWHKTGDPTPPIMAINAHERTSQIDRLTATTRVKLPPSHSHYWRPSTQPALQPPMQPAKRPSRARQYPYGHPLASIYLHQTSQASSIGNRALQARPPRHNQTRPRPQGEMQKPRRRPRPRTGQTLDQQRARQTKTPTTRREDARQTQCARQDLGMHAKDGSV